MTSSRHTPGPWAINPSSPCVVTAAYLGAKPPIQIDIAIFYGRNGEEAKANAQLFLSAPGLLAERDHFRVALEKIAIGATEAADLNLIDIARKAIRIKYNSNQLQQKKDQP